MRTHAPGRTTCVERRSSKLRELEAARAGLPEWRLSELLVNRNAKVSVEVKELLTDSLLKRSSVSRTRSRASSRGSPSSHRSSSSSSIDDMARAVVPWTSPGER